MNACVRQRQDIGERSPEREVRGGEHFEVGQLVRSEQRAVGLIEI